MKVTLFLTMLAMAPVASSPQGRNDASMTAADFSKVTSRRAAEHLANTGTLVRIMLFPAELGGEDIPENIAYVPPEAAAAQHLIIGTLAGQFRKRLIDNLTVTPDYKGSSVVPSRIVMKATHSKKRGEFSPTIEIW